jgi:type II secretory pathway pseudopilin PulG
MLEGVKRSSVGLTFPEILIAACTVILALFIAATMLVRPFSGRDSSPKSQAKNDVVQIATAITSYQTEYGHLPPGANGPVNRALVDILTGNDTKANPRKIVFIEMNPWKLKRGGTNTAGDFLDPWGSPYFVATSESGTIGQAGSVPGRIAYDLPKSVAVWNVPATTLTREAHRQAVISWE